MNTTPAALATLTGQHFVADGTNSIAARRMSKDNINVIGTRTSTSYGTSLTSGGSGPSVSLTTGAYAQVGLHSYIGCSAVDLAWMSFVISGATTLAASDNRALASDDVIKASAVHWLVGNTPGVNVFDASYRTDSGTATYDDRTLWILPF